MRVSSPPACPCAVGLLLQTVADAADLKSEMDAQLSKVTADAEELKAAFDKVRPGYLVDL